MSKKRLWYLSGGMTKFGKDEFYKSEDWRRDLKEQIERISDGNVLCFNPNMHYSCIDAPNNYTDREAMNLNIYKLRNSELVIYNNNDPYSRGSMIEIGIAYERRIPIIVLNEANEEIHCWISSIAEKIFDNREDLVDYLLIHYLDID